MPNPKEITIDKHGGGPMNRFQNKAEKLKNPKGTVKRLLEYLGNKIRMLILIFSLTLITTVINIIGTRLNGYIEEMVSGQKAVLLFSEEEHVKEEFSKINKKLTKSAIFAQALSGCMGPVNNSINNLTYLIVTVSGGYLILNGKNITVGILFNLCL